MVLLVFPIGPALGAQEFWLPAPLDSLIAAARADSNDPVLHHLVALGHLNRHKLDLAERAFREALVVDPHYAPAHLGLAIITLERYPDLMPPPGRRPRRLSPAALEAGERGRAGYRLAFLLDPLVHVAAPDAPHDTSTTVRPWAFGGRMSTEFAGLAAFGAHVRGEYHRAFALSQWIVAQHETYQVGGAIPSQILWIHALAGARLKRFDPGIRDLTLLIERSRAVEVADTAGTLQFLVTNDYRYMLGYFRSRAGYVSSAIQTFRDVLVFDLGAWMAHVRLAELYDRVGRKEEALAEWREALFLNPDDPMLEMDVGLALARAGQLAAGDSALARAMARLPRHAVIWYHRGQIAWLLGDGPAARAAFERFLALAPRRLSREIADARLALAGIP